MTTPVPDEVLGHMCASDRVNVRTWGVIARWLRNHSAVDPAYDELEMAKDLIATMTGAGLLTFIGDEFDAYIDALSRRTDHR